MDQKKKIQFYMTQIHKMHQENTNLAAMMLSDFESYEKIMAEKLPRFKEDYKTLFKMAIREFNQVDFQRKLEHFLSITQNVINGKRTLEDATKQVADEQYKEYVAKVVEKKD